MPPTDTSPTPLPCTTNGPTVTIAAAVSSNVAFTPAIDTSSYTLASEALAFAVDAVALALHALALTVDGSQTAVTADIIDCILVHAVSAVTVAIDAIAFIVDIVGPYIAINDAGLLTL